MKKDLSEQLSLKERQISFGKEPNQSSVAGGTEIKGSFLTSEESKMEI